jgi:hypothetical protein
MQLTAVACTCATANSVTGWCCDITAAAAAQTELTAYEKFSEPREVDVLRVIPNKKEMGTAFKKVIE